MRDNIALAHRVNPLSALTSEFRRAMNGGENRHLATPLNSVTAATLFPGTRNASVQHAAADCEMHVGRSLHSHIPSPSPAAFVVRIRRCTQRSIGNEGKTRENLFALVSLCMQPVGLRPERRCKRYSRHTNEPNNADQPTGASEEKP